MIDLTQVLNSLIRQAAKHVSISTDVGAALSMIPVLASIRGRSQRGRSKEEPPTSPTSGQPSERERTLASQVQQLRNLLRLTATLSATLNYEHVLGMVLDLAVSAFDEPGSSSGGIIGALLLFSGEKLHVAAARGFTQPDLRAVFPGEEGVIEASLSNAQPFVMESPARDPELQRVVALHSCSEAVCIPLIVGLEAYGLLLFAHPQARYFNDYRLEILEAVANQGIIALQNAQLYRDLELEKERIIEIQEETRKKLARDLHDGPTQSIGAIAMRVNFARRLLTRDLESASEELFKIEELARRTTKEIRQMLFTLRPLVLESEGLVVALHQLARNLKENHNQNVVVEAQPDCVDDLEVGKQGVVFFIVDEAVNNARKHAQAEHIWVRLVRKGDLLLLEVEDDGVGFDLSAVESNYDQRGSLGMVNLRERAEMVRGLISIETGEGKGTRIRVTIPMTMEAAEKIHRSGYVS
jgi:signal transduction histidine kinase